MSTITFVDNNKILLFLSFVTLLFCFLLPGSRIYASNVFGGAGPIWQTVLPGGKVSGGTRVRSGLPLAGAIHRGHDSTDEEKRRRMNNIEITTNE